MYGAARRVSLKSRRSHVQWLCQLSLHRCDDDALGCVSRLCTSMVHARPTPCLTGAIRQLVATDRRSPLLLLPVCTTGMQHTAENTASGGNPFLCLQQACMLAGLSLPSPNPCLKGYLAHSVPPSEACLHQTSRCKKPSACRTLSPAYMERLGREAGMAEASGAFCGLSSARFRSPEQRQASPQGVRSIMMSSYTMGQDALICASPPAATNSRCRRGAASGKRLMVWGCAKQGCSVCVLAARHSLLVGRLLERTVVVQSICTTGQTALISALLPAATNSRWGVGCLPLELSRAHSSPVPSSIWELAAS